VAEQPRRRNALAHLGLAACADTSADAGVVLSELPFRHQIAVRGDSDDPALIEAVQQVIGAKPPTEHNTAAGPADLAAGPRILWLGPDEWLVVSADNRAAALASALATQHAAVVDVSDGRTVISISGPNARDLLAKGCPLDLHPRVFAPGRCAQTVIAHAHVIIHQIDDAPCYEVYVHRSFADYFWHWLEDAANEYGMAVASD